MFSHRVRTISHDFTPRLYREEYCWMRRTLANLRTLAYVYGACSQNMHATLWKAEALPKAAVAARSHFPHLTWHDPECAPQGIPRLRYRIDCIDAAMVPA